MKRFLATFALAGIAALAACAAGPKPVEDASMELKGARYVALGSSFAAGSGIGAIKPGTPERCGRSAENYASLLAEKLDLKLEDATCGGATTAHILGPWDELPPQIDAVTPDTRLVTVTVGGNDIGYVAYLIGESCKVRGPIRMKGVEIPCFDPVVPHETVYAKLAADMRRVAQEVRQRAPHAQLVFVEYVRLIPDKPCQAMPLSAEAAKTARGIGDHLARITADVAAESGALLIEADALSASHTPCDPAPWSIGFPPDWTEGDGAPWHPNRAGHAELARILASRLGG